MEIYTVGGGILAANAYLLVSEENTSGILIDAGCSISALNRVVEKHADGIAAVFLTHGHFDHLICLEKIIEQYNPKVYIHEQEASMIKDASENMSDKFMRKSISLGDADVLLKDDDEIKIHGISIKVIHTPGHSMGSCVFMVEGNAFTGDTLFKGSIGRFDFPHSDFELLLNSLNTIKKILPKDTIIYPGHGKHTTMAEEMINNIHLQF